MASLYVIEKAPALVVESGDKNRPSSYTKTEERVYALQHTSSADLTGAALTTVNMGAIVCAAGSMSYNKDMTEIFQFDGATGAWAEV